MQVVEYPDRAALATGLADRLAASLAAALRTGGASFCVTGGGSPAAVYGHLSGVDLDWAQVSVFLNDERWVPVGDEKSNTAMVHRTLLTDRAAAARWVPLVSEAATPEAGIPELEAGIAACLPISVLLLGMGEDGHTASLFPAMPQLAAGLAPDAPTLMGVDRADGLPGITLTAPALHSARETHLLILGEAKRRVLYEARGADPMAMPVAAFLPGATVHWAP